MQYLFWYSWYNMIFKNKIIMEIIKIETVIITWEIYCMDGKMTTLWSVWINDIFVKEKVQSSYFNRGEIITQEQLQNIQKSYLQSGVKTNKTSFWICYEVSRQRKNKMLV